MSDESTASTAASDGTAHVGPPPPLDLELAAALSQDVTGARLRWLRRLLER